MFDKILIANRGEIAVRIARTCRERGVQSVAVHSDPDEGARHVRVSDESVNLPGVAPVDTYLNMQALIEAAKATGSQAIHPGYGFLSENADFAEAVTGAGLVWIGPPPEATRAIGDKVKARNIANAAGVPVVPGLLEPVESLDVVHDFGAEHGYPLAIKAAGGGGGRGLKVAKSQEEIEDAFNSARREAEAYFGSRDVYVEKYLESPKHLEVQLLAPNPDEAMWLGVRDCSLQRRHQKLIEETPPPLWSERMSEMGEAAVALSKACGYVNAGTVEMLVDDEGRFYFLEVNARLQVEHTVTEADPWTRSSRLSASDRVGRCARVLSSGCRGAHERPCDRVPCQCRGSRARVPAVVGPDQWIRGARGVGSESRLGIRGRRRDPGCLRLLDLESNRVGQRQGRGSRANGQSVE